MERLSMNFCKPFVCLLLLGGCASLGLKSQVPKGPLRVSNLATFSLTGRTEVSFQPLETKDWQWRGRNALGAGPQSFVAPILLGGDDALLVTLGGGVGLYDLRSGKPRWFNSIPVGVGCIPQISSSQLYVAGMDGVVRRMDLRTGKLKWETKLSAESLGGVALGAGFVYVTTADDALWALDEKTGQVQWSYKRPAPKGSLFWSLRGTSTPLLSPDAMKLFVGFSDGVFVALEAVSGQTVWERNFERSGRFKDADQRGVMSSSGDLIYLPLVDGDLLALKTSDGSTLWSIADAGAATPLLDEAASLLYVVTNQGHLQKHSLVDTKLLWSTAVDKALVSSPVKVGAGYLAMTTSQKGLVFVDASVGTVVEQRNMGPGILAPPAFDGRRLLIISSRNRLLMYRVDLRAPKA